MLEVWKPVIGYEELYEVSNLGNIRSFSKWSKGRLLKPYWHKTGYKQVRLCLRDKPIKTFFIHRVIWEAFNGAITSNMVINHLNGIKHDNRLENLECVTTLENVRHAIKTGLTNNNGERNKASKLKAWQVLEIRERYAAGGVTQTQLANEYGVKQTVVSDIIRRRWWRHI